jgi:hypothetical protein
MNYKKNIFLLLFSASSLFAREEITNIQRAEIFTCTVKLMSDSGIMWTNKDEQTEMAFVTIFPCLAITMKNEFSISEEKLEESKKQIHSLLLNMSKAVEKGKYRYQTEEEKATLLSYQQFPYSAECLKQTDISSCKETPKQIFDLSF